MALAEESVQAPAVAVVPVVAAVFVAVVVAGAAEPEHLLRNSSGRRSARLGRTARRSDSSRKEKEVWLPCYSSSFGLVMTQLWKLWPGRIRAGYSVRVPEKSGARIIA